jgi:hypothetical protein
VNKEMLVLPLSRLLIVALVLSLLAYAHVQTSASWSPPDEEVQRASPAERCVEAFVNAINAGTPEATRIFEENFRSERARAARSMGERIALVRRLHEQWGWLTVKEIVSATDQIAVARVESEHQGQLEFTFEFEPGEEGRISVIRIERLGEAVPVDAEARARLIESVARALKDVYVFPEVGEQMATMLEGKLAAGEYDAINLQRDLAQRITEDLQKVSGDKHLRAAAAQPAGRGPQAGPAPTSINGGFRKAEILEGNIGYIRLDGFASGEDAERIAAAAMSFVANADSVIFDLRHNGGGSPEMIRFISSYLFEEPTHLNSFYDREGNRTSEYWTVAEVSGKRIRPDAKVYVLTSSFTFSAAEEFTYNLQALKRAVIVGETTGGGAHPVRRVQVDEPFILIVPYMRAHNPVTGTNWEGVGVRPDIETPADQALDRAIEELVLGPRRAMLLES